MANETLSAPLARPRSGFGVIAAAFIALLLLIFVGLQPFASAIPRPTCRPDPIR